MKQMTLSLSVTIAIVLVSVHGWAQTSSVASPDDTKGTDSNINELFSNFSQKIHSEIHTLTNECMSDVAKIPSDEKTKWCQEQKQKKITMMQQQEERMGSMGQKTNPYWEQQVQQLQDDLDRCQYVADEMLIDQCGTFEKSMNMDMQRLSNMNT